MLNYLYTLATDERKGFIASLLKSLLYLLSLLYGLAVRILIFFNRLKPYKIDCKVISVGNITLGGTGKTPLVEYIATYLKKEGHKVAVLSRGYKRNSKLKIKNSKFNYQTMGDEPYMLSKILKDIPVIVDRNRIRVARRAIKDFSVDTLILDDGFQQWKIKKDLEIVTIDATCPFGNGHLLPRGILRQPLSALKRADIFVLTKTNLNPDIQDIKDFLKPINPQAIIVEAMHKPLGFYRLGDERSNLLELDPLKNKTVGLICGIADPDSFENLIISLGINVGFSFRFSDHHDYRQKDLDKVARAAKEKNIDTVITTEKDAVRLLPLCVSRLARSCLPAGRCSVFVLRIELKIIQDEIFTQRIHSLY